MGNTRSVCSRGSRACCGCSGIDAAAQDMSSVCSRYWCASCSCRGNDADSQDMFVPAPVQASTSIAASASESMAMAAVAAQPPIAAEDPLVAVAAQPPSIAAEDPLAPPQCSTSASVSASAVPDHALQSILDISNDGVDGELAPLIADIRILLNYAKGSPSSSLHDPKPDSRWKFIDTSPLASLKDFFWKAADAASGPMPSDQSEALKSVVKTELNRIGKAHWVAAGLMAVAFVLDRFNLISSNKAECLDLLDEMCRLAEYLQLLKQRKKLKLQVLSMMEEAVQLVIQGSALCLSQAISSGWYRFFSGSVHKRHLEDLRHYLEEMYKHLKFQVIIRASNAQETIELPRMEFYPNDAVIPDGTVEKIVELLELESDKHVVVVILHGFGGIGKTTLANAVYAKVDDILGFKFSRVVLNENIESVPSILAVQNKMLDDISEIQVKPSTSRDGQILLQKCFGKDPCFIYIDNVLNARELAKVLPANLSTSTKLRLLMTARDAGVSRGLRGINSRNDVKVLSVDSLPEAEALTMLKQEMGSDLADKLSEEQRNYLLKEVCRGVPLLIELVSRHVRHNRDINEAVDVIRQQRECAFGEQLGGENVDLFSFALDGLQQCYTEAFFDICAFFYHGVQWNYLQNIYGEDTMEVLERRALVKQTFDEYTEGVLIQMEEQKVAKVHDVLLQMGQSRCKSNRITTVAQLKSMIQSGDFQGVKGIYIYEINEETVTEETVTEEVLTLPCSKLDLISSSLRILSLDFQRKHGNTVLPGMRVEGKCEADFSSLILFQSLFWQPPFDVRRCIQLTHLAYAPNCTLYLHEMPSSLKILDLHLKEENAVIGNAQNEHGVVSTLREFRLRGNYLREIPHGLLYNMKSLVTFGLYLAPHVRYMPEELHTLPCLTMIDIRYVALKGLPESIGACTSLKILSLRNCPELVRLSHAIVNLSCLEVLYMDNCSNLLCLPADFEQLMTLRILTMCGCTNLKSLGPTFCELPCLEVLDLRYCFQLHEKWMDIFVQMKSLKVLYLEGCPPLIKRWEELYADGINVKCIY